MEAAVEEEVVVAAVMEWDDLAMAVACTAAVVLVVAVQEVAATGAGAPLVLFVPRGVTTMTLR